MAAARVPLNELSQAEPEAIARAQKAQTLATPLACYRKRLSRGRFIFPLAALTVSRPHQSLLLAHSVRGESKPDIPSSARARLTESPHLLIPTPNP